MVARVPGNVEKPQPGPALGTGGTIWYLLSSATVPFGDAKGNGVSRRTPTKPRLPPQLCVGSERPKLISHWETGKAGRKRRRRMVRSTIRRKHPPARRPAAASVAQPPNGEYSAERTPVSATREARLRERDGLWPHVAHSSCLHAPCLAADRPRRPPTRFLVTRQRRHEEYGDARHKLHDS